MSNVRFNFDHESMRATKHLDAMLQMLWTRQLEEWPDSKEVSIQTALQWPFETEVPYLSETMLDWDKNWEGAYDEVTLMVLREAKVKDTITQYQLRTARAITMCLQYPVGVFYTCGKGGKYKGFRYGVEGHEYISGFGA